MNRSNCEARSRFRQIIVALFASVLLGALVFLPAASPQVSAYTPEVQIDRDWGRMPLYFIANQGRLDEAVGFHVQGSDKTLYFTAEGVTFSLVASDEEERWTTKLDYLGAQEVAPQGQDKTEAIISYFQGSPEDWDTAIPTYSSILYSDLWPGIDLAYSGTQDQLKQEFVLEPGADPEVIRLSYRGASLSLNEQGDLEVSTPVGGFTDEAPIAYQMVDGKRMDVPVAYVLDEPMGTGADETTAYGFSLGAYDPALPLVIDPAVVVYCGYIGGEFSDFGRGIAVDSSGCAYVTGITSSSQTSFPDKTGPDISHNGGVDAFVAKINASGTGFVYCGYIGGSGADFAYAIAVDAVGCACVTGSTTSTETTAFPVLGGPSLTHGTGLYDAFVARVNANGTSLIYSGFIGGSDWDYGRAIAVDSGYNAYIVGDAASTQTSFPVTTGSIDTTQNGGNDAFVAKVNTSGGLVYCGYIGGEYDDCGYGVAVDSSGCAYVAGYASSTQTTFPEKTGPYTANSGSYDAFVAKVNSTGSSLVYCGFIGGSSNDYGQGIAVDSSGCAYIAGYTYSSSAPFPTIGGLDSSFGGGSDAFVAKVMADGTGLTYCGYLGGDNAEKAYGIAVDSSGRAHVAGYTFSTEATFPVAGGPDSTTNGDYEGFVARVNAAGSALSYCGYVGGDDEDYCRGIAVDSSGCAYVTGETYSTEATFPVVKNSIDTSYNGDGLDQDAFVAKIALADRYEQDSSELGYARSWSTLVNAKASGGTSAECSSGGASVIVKFYGDHLGWVARKSSGGGIVRITVDYGSPQLVNLYSATASWQEKAWETPAGLSEGYHRVIIERTTKQDPSSIGTGINADAFDVMGTLAQAPVRYQQNWTGVRYTGTWSTSNATSASADTFRRTNTPGSTVKVKFTGSSIVWVGLRAPAYGKASISLDGNYQGTVDLYASTQKWERSLWAKTMTDGQHTLVITCTGDKQAAANDCYINADAFDIQGVLGWH